MMTTRESPTLPESLEQHLALMSPPVAESAQKARTAREAGSASTGGLAAKGASAAKCGPVKGLRRGDLGLRR
jgi:hypothetical protein